MLKLDSTLYFSKGYCRSCYFHPSDDNLCVKIADFSTPKRNKGILKAIQRENDYYKSLQKKLTNWEHLSQYYGDVETNLGQGSLYQMIRDDNGNVAKNLDTYFNENSFMNEYEETLIKEFRNLYIYLQQNQIMTTAIFPRNIVAKRNGDAIKLIIIDDIGNTEFLKISELSKFFATKKLNRKWTKMATFITKKYPQVSENLVKSLTSYLVL